MNYSKQWFIHLALVVMAFLGLSCGALDGDPEVYLVKDSDNSYHLQWTEPLEEQRIVLIKITGIIEILWDNGEFAEREFESERLLIFPAGVFRSDQFRGLDITPSTVTGGDRLTAVEIPPAKARFNVDLPKRAFHTESKEYEELLVGHPFQPYEVGEPSELTFGKSTGLGD